MTHFLNKIEFGYRETPASEFHIKNVLQLSIITVLQIQYQHSSNAVFVGWDIDDNYEELEVIEVKR